MSVAQQLDQKHSIVSATFITIIAILDLVFTSASFTATNVFKFKYLTKTFLVGYRAFYNAGHTGGTASTHPLTDLLNFWLYVAINLFAI